MARTDWQYSDYVALSNRKNSKIGLAWRYANTEEEAKRDNKDIIYIKPFVIRTGSDGGWAYNNNWYEGSYYSYKIGSGSEKKYSFDTRYWYGNNETGSHIDNNTKYYLQYTSDSTTTAKKANPIWTRNKPTGSVVSGSSIYFKFEVPHKEDGTQDNVVIRFHLDGTSSHGDATVSVTFTPTRIERGTKIWKKTDVNPSVNNGWERIATIGVKDHAATEQHYVYKKINDTTWERIYG